MATFYQFVYRGVHNMATYILVDTANTFFRARHVVRGDLDTKVGMALHITLAGVKKAWQDFNADHVVFCLEGRSWRKDFYLPYTVMRHSQLEADDLIAGWVQAHPNDNHVIISTDGDFAQLIAPNCKQYNGIQDITITHEGYFDKKGNHVIDKKTKEAKPAPHPDFMLFEKCMRGDTSDNVFSAYPGVRKKGTKNKVGLIEAYDDKSNKGFNWNNMMLQRWTDHEGAEHRVLDDYQRNVVLCDLTAQPKEIRDIINETIDENAKPKQVQQVGMRLMKFCAKWDMQRIADQAQYFAEPLNAKYPE